MVCQWVDAHTRTHRVRKTSPAHTLAHAHTRSHTHARAHTHTRAQVQLDLEPDEAKDATLYGPDPT